MEALSQQVQVPIEVDWVHRESELDLQYTYVGSNCPAAQFEWVVGWLTFLYRRMSRARFELINNALFGKWSLDLKMSLRTLNRTQIFKTSPIQSKH